ncbi:MAG: CBS and ACT domain-containing protein [Anaerolineales bacterium]
MIVRDYMTRHPIMIEPTKKAIEARKLMAENNIRHLPVVGDGKRVLGLVTRSRMTVAPETLASLDVWEITRYLANLTVEKVMVHGGDLHTVGPDATLEEAADILIQHKIGGLPVVEDGIVVGVITETDLLVELQHLLGANEPGCRLTMRVPDQRGEFSKLAAAISERGWGIMALGSVRSPKDESQWDIVVKVRNCGIDELQTVVSDIDGQAVVDLRATMS